MRILTALLVFAAIGCRIEPAPLDYGKDNCNFCKMTLVDIKFGAEVITKKGKTYKFDDINCMVSFLNSGSLTLNEIKDTMVTDYMQPGLIPAQTAFYLKSDKVHSPMNSHVAAFDSMENRDSKKTEWGGTDLGWKEVITEFK